MTLFKLYPEDKTQKPFVVTAHCYRMMQAQKMLKPYYRISRFELEIDKAHELNLTEGIITAQDLFGQDA